MRATKVGGENYFIERYSRASKQIRIIHKAWAFGGGTAKRRGDSQFTSNKENSAQLLIGRFLILELFHVANQRLDFCTLEFFSKSRHAPLAASHYRDQTSSTRDIGIFLPPLQVSEVRRVVCMTEPCVASPIPAMTTRTIVV